MHTTPGATPGVSFTHNGDFSGDVGFTVPAEKVEHLGEGAARVWLDLEDLQAIVAEHIRRLRIDELESSTPSRLLGVPPR